MAKVIGTSRYLPLKVVDNKDLTQFPEKYRNVIAEKAGVLSRRHVDDECTSDIGAKAVSALLEKLDIDSDSVEILICATSSPDRIQPATATRIQDLCGLKNAYAFDVNSVCSSAVYAMKIASSLVNDGAKNVIVVASEVYSKILNPSELKTYPYFGDGAAAVFIADSENEIEGYDLVDFVLGSDGAGSDVIQVPAGGTMLPAWKVKNEKDFYFKMDGRKVYEFACDKGTELIERLRSRNNIDPEVVIPHQANANVIKEIARRSGLSNDLFYVNLDRFANTAGASVLIAFDEYIEKGHESKNLFLVVFGGGLSWAGCFLKKY